MQAKEDTPGDLAEAEVLRGIERRILWLATSVVHHANRVRPNRSGVKVGGHQASSASMASIMTALWFAHLEAEDRVSVKPHASPVLHAISYLLSGREGLRHHNSPCSQVDVHPPNPIAPY
jgi:pyruvate dehydrogenase E1 component